MENIVHDLYGCYLLYCLNPKFNGRTYIGFTVNPKRRIKQHNAGVHAGGAKGTNAKGPWEMVLMVYGFPNEISALRFEWAWQHPNKSRRLKHIKSKSFKENQFKYRVRIMCEMLCVGPWNHLPLTIQWLKQDYAVEFSPYLLPPVHMPICFGPIISKRVNKKKHLDLESVTHMPSATCYLCCKNILCINDRLFCPNPTCGIEYHVICCARYFLKNISDQVIPIEGKCSKCHQSILWGDLIRYKHGCYKNLNEMDST